MTSPLDGKVSHFGLSVDTLHAFLHAPEGDIETEFGPMPNLRKLANEMKSEAVEAVDREIGDFNSAAQSVDQRAAEVEQNTTIALEARDAAIATGNLYGSEAEAQGDADLPVGSGYVAPLPDGSLQAYRKDSSLASTKIGGAFASAAKLQAANDRVTAAVGVTSRVGLIGIPSAGAGAADAATYVFSPVAVANGVLQRAVLHALAAGTLTIRRFTKAGDVFTFVSEKAVAIETAGPKSLTTADFGDFPVLAGERIGFFPSAGLLAYALGPVDASSGWYSSPLNVTTSFADATVSPTTQLQIGFDVAVPAVTGAAFKAAQAGIEANTESIDVLAGALPSNTPVVGLVDQVTPGIGADLNTWLFNVPAEGSGVIEKFSIKASVAGTIHRVIYERAGDEFTLVRSDPFVLTVGDQEVIDGVNIKQGQHFGVSMVAGGAVMRAITRTVPAELAWRFGPAASPATFTSTVRTSAHLQMDFRLKVITPVAGQGRHPLTLKNSNRIGLPADSIGTGWYQQAGKAWVCKVSLFSDWNFESMAVSGDTAEGQLTKIRNGTIVYNDMGWLNYGVDVALVPLGANDAVLGTLTKFRESMRQMLQTLRGLGAIPAVSTEFLTTFNDYAQVAYKNIAQQEGALLCDVLESARTMDFGTKYAGFYATSGVAHPGVRTNDLIADPTEKFLKRFGRPRRSMKIFRKRSVVAVSTVADLMFDGNEGRARLFKEINIGHRALALASEKFYDELMPVAAYASGVLVQSEYLKLMGGGTVAFADYGLIDAIFDAVAKNMDRVEVTLSDMAVELYIRDVLGAPIQADGLPVGTWKQVVPAGGKFTIQRADLVRAMNIDKLSMLLHKTGGFSIAEPVIVMYGELGKTLDPFVEPQNRARGPELLAKTDCDSTAGWTLVGLPGALPTAAVPLDGMLPRGATKCITVNATDKLRQSFVYPQDDRWDNEVEIRVRCRRWVPIFPSSGDYATAPITADSYDWAQLTVDVMASGEAMPIKARVNLSWHDVVLRTILPLGTTTMDLQLSADLNVQIAMVSVKHVSS